MDQIGKYRVVRIVGEGGMGRVYEATDPIINRRVAIKTISQSVVQDPETRARFLREAQAAGQLSHPNLITIFDVGEEDGSPFIVMEYLEGEELSRVIAKQKLALDARLRLMIEVCQGLAYAHSKGLVHRDIKPANIFITAGQQVKILDFGLARGAVSEITQTGHVVGTPSYMSPEQVRGDRVDHRADIFSVGVVLYEVLSGQKAFKGDSVAATIFQVLERQPDPLEQLDPHLPTGLSKVVERALAKDPKARYQHMDEMLMELTAIRIQSQPTTSIARPTTPYPAGAPPASPPPSFSAAAASPAAGSMGSPGALVPQTAEAVSSRKRSWPWLVAGGAAAAVAAVVLLVARPYRSAPPAPSAPQVQSPAPSSSAPPSNPVQAPAPASSSEARAPEAPRKEPPPVSPTRPRTGAAPIPAQPGSPPARNPERSAEPSAPPPSRPSPQVVPSPPPPQEIPGVALPREVSPPPQQQPERAAPVPESRPPAAPPATAAPAATPSAAAPPSAPVDPTLGIRETMARYKSALEARDLTALKQVWPGLAGRQETAIKDEFQNARAIAVELQGLTPVVSSNTAIVTCRRDYAVTMVDGRTLKTATKMTVTLNRRNGAWVIDNIRHEAER